MKSSTSTRVWFAFMAAIIWIGIYLTGFSTVSRILYVPAAGFIVAALVGLCPSQLAMSKILGSKNV